MATIKLDRSTGLNKEARLLHQESKRIIYNSIGTSILAERLVLHTIFKDLKRNWIRETINYSSPSDIFGNQHYLKIIKLGPFLLDCILDDLTTEPHLWFEALSQITNVNPIEEDHLGDIGAMAQDWINWGETR